MKLINFLIGEIENTVENTKVSAAFVQELKEAFSMSPIKPICVSNNLQKVN